MKFIKYEGHEPLLIALNGLYSDLLAKWKAAKQSQEAVNACRAKLKDKQYWDNLRVAEPDENVRPILQRAQVAFELARNALEVADCQCLDAATPLAKQLLELETWDYKMREEDKDVSANNRAAAQHLLANARYGTSFLTNLKDDITSGDGEDVLRMYVAYLHEGSNKVSKRLSMWNLDRTALVQLVPDPSDRPVLELLSLFEKARETEKKLRETQASLKKTRALLNEPQYEERKQKAKSDERKRKLEQEQTQKRCDYISDRIAFCKQIARARSIVETLDVKRKEVYATMPDWRERYDLKTKLWINNLIIASELMWGANGLVGLSNELWAEVAFDPTKGEAMRVLISLAQTERYVPGLPRLRTGPRAESLSVED